VPVILLLAAAAILACAVLAALGRAGEMAAFPSDSAPLRLDEVTAADVALLRPPLALWGYSVPATEEALGVIARAVTARDTEIAALRKELAEMRASPWPAQPEPVGSWPGGRVTGETWPAGQPTGPARAHDEVPAWPAPPEPGPGE
jgi:hypothetical protein